MTVERDDVHQDDQSLGPSKEDLNRLMIEEFYKDSVERYGADSEQARALSKFLTPASAVRDDPPTP